MADAALDNDLKKAIRTIPDYPKPGIMFRDITTLLGDARAFRRAVDELVQPWAGQKIDKVAGIEARGFILGGAVAAELGAGFVPVRKSGKLPYVTIGYEYALEYGTATLEIHRDAIQAGQRVLIVDDLLATGGTVMGTIELVQRLGGDVAGLSFMVELSALKGREQLSQFAIHTLLTY